MRPLALILLLGLALAPPSARAQEVGLSLGTGALTPGTPRAESFGRADLALNGYVALRPRAVFAPVAAFHLAQFALRDEDVEGGGLRLYGVTAGVRVRPFPRGRVNPYARLTAGVGGRVYLEDRDPASSEVLREQSHDVSLTGDIVVGASLGGRGLFGYAEAGYTSWEGGVSESAYYGARAGVGYRF